jgi:hypothetical protein
MNRNLLSQLLIIGVLSSCATTSKQREDVDPSERSTQTSVDSDHQRDSKGAPPINVLAIENRDGDTVRPMKPDEGLRANQEYSMYFSEVRPLYVYVAAMSPGGGTLLGLEVLYPPKGESPSPVSGPHERIPSQGGWLRPSRDSNKLLIIVSPKPLGIDSTTDEANYTAAMEVKGVTTQAILLAQPVNNAESAAKPNILTAADKVSAWKWSLPFMARDEEQGSARELEPGEMLRRGGSYALYVDADEPLFFYVMGMSRDGKPEVVYPLHGQSQPLLQGTRVRIPSADQWLRPRTDLGALFCLVSRRPIPIDTSSDENQWKRAAEVLKIDRILRLAR